jgi:hypothetical protein
LPVPRRKIIELDARALLIDAGHEAIRERSLTVACGSEPVAARARLVIGDPECVVIDLDTLAPDEWQVAAA